MTFVLAPFPITRRPYRSTSRLVRMTAVTAKQATRWVLHQLGAVVNLSKEETTVPPPDSNEVRITVKATGLNFADVFTCLGLYELAGSPPITPGFEVCGVVDAVGSSVDDLKPGDKVIALTRFGGYTTVLNVDRALVQTLPEKWSFEQGAAFPAQTFTAWYSLCLLGGLPSDGSAPLQVTSESKNVLIHSAAGGVGLQLVEMVHRIGGKAVCTIGSERKIDVLRERGIPRERIIVRGLDDKAGFENVVRDRALGGEGVDVVIDSVMGEYFQPGFDLLNLGGRYIVMGSASLMPKGPLDVLKGGILSLLKLGWKFLNRPKLDLVSCINENKTVSCFNLAALFDQTKLMKNGFGQLAGMKLPPPMVGKTFKFEEAHEALKFFQTGQSFGKIVLVIDEENS